MAYVKLDTGILDSSLWMERAQREIFITALLLAVPLEIKEPMAQYEVRDLKPTGFVVPPGWYGFIEAAGVGIVRRALLPKEEGLSALEALGAEDSESRSSAHGGRRLVRVNGGYVLLNYIHYRDKDHTVAERQRRFRERKKMRESLQSGPSITALQLSNVTDVTHADADADAKTPPTPLSRGDELEEVNAFRSRQVPPLPPLTEKEYRIARAGLDEYRKARGTERPGPRRQK